MSVSVRTRFEVFKRDRFTCVYCGKTPPNILLEVDHVLPVAAGGDDEVENLCTSCWDCNRGKADRMLEEGARPIGRAMIEDVQERIDQAKAYADLMRQMRAIEETQLGEITNAWARIWSARISEREDGTHWYTLPNSGKFLDASSMRAILRRSSLLDVLDAIDLMPVRRFGYASHDACRYFYGICWRRIKAGRT